MGAGLVPVTSGPDGTFAGGQDNNRELGRCMVREVLGQQELSGGAVVDLHQGDRSGRGDDAEGVGWKGKHGVDVSSPVRGQGVRASGLDWQGVGFAVLSAGDRSGFIRWPASGHDILFGRSCGGVEYHLSAGTPCHTVEGVSGIRVSVGSICR